VRHRLGLATRTQISVCKPPFPSAGIAVSLFRAKTVQQRPQLPREVETRLPDCGVSVGIGLMWIVGSDCRVCSEEKTQTSTYYTVHTLVKTPSCSKTNCASENSGTKLTAENTLIIYFAFY